MLVAAVHSQQTKPHVLGIQRVACAMEFEVEPQSSSPVLRSEAIQEARFQREFYSVQERGSAEHSNRRVIMNDTVTPKRV